MSKRKPFLEIKPLAQAAEESFEVKNWKRFRNPIIAKQVAPVTHISFSPVDPFEFAVTSSTRVQIFDPDTNESRKSFSQFKDVAYGADFRKDGKLLCAGGDEGIIRVFGVENGVLLRQLRGHQGTVRVCKFSYGESQIISGSHDRTSRVWDVSTGTEIACFRGHDDYVWCGAANPATPNVWVTGGYDHKINVWDIRGKNIKFTMDNMSPVEDLLIFPSGSVVATAGKNEIKIWDLLGGGRLLDVISAHSKTITSLAINYAGTRLLSGALDHLVKVYDVTNYTPVHTIPYSAPIMSIAISPNDSHLVVGMSDSSLNIKTKRVDMSERVNLKENQEALRGGTYRYFLNGKNAQTHKEDFRTQSEKRSRIKQYEVQLRKFKYQDSLNAVLVRNTPPVVTLSMLDELIVRNALETAVQGRNEQTLYPLLQFLISYITQPEYSKTLIRVSSVVLELYVSILGSSPKIDESFRQLKKAVDDEVTLQKQLLSMIGSLDLLFATANLVRIPDESKLVSKKKVKTPGHSNGDQQDNTSIDASDELDNKMDIE